MRLQFVLSGLILAASSSAHAQVIPFQIDELRMQQQAADRRAIDQANQLQALDARLRADQAVAEMQVQRLGARVPQLPHPDVSAIGAIALPRYPAMSDAALATSNQRVQDAARNRR